MRDSTKNIGRILLATGLVGAAGVALAGPGWPGGVLLRGGGVRAAHDLSVKMKASDVTTLGPFAKLKVKNSGTSDENGARIRIFADSPEGPELFSETVNIPAGKSAALGARVYPDSDASILVVLVEPAEATDENPADNEARVGLGLKGSKGKLLVGRALHRANCAECHGEDGAGGTGPSLLRAKSKTIFARAHSDEVGSHAFPWLTKNDSKDLGKFLKDPSKVVLPPEPPTPPEGGWPVYETALRDLFESKCSNCHTKEIKGGVALGSYRGASVNAKKALSAVRRGSMPPGKGNLDPQKVQLLEDWITGGKRP